MNRRRFLTLGAPVVAGPLLLTRRSEAQAAAPSTRALPAAGADGWVSLFNGRNLDGWYTVLQRSGRDVAQRNGYVTIENGLLHIMGSAVMAETAESGYIATHEEYENVRIRMEYKWGVKRFAPRLEYKRDNGLLYYVVGADRVWPTCVECQIQETDTGDVFLLGGTRAIQGSLPGNGGAGFIRLVTGGGTAEVAPTGGRKLKDGDFENRDDWNLVEVIAQGDRATHLVNGRIVNLLSSIQQPDTQNAGQYLPLKRGKIGIEIEYAEIWIRRVEIKPLA